MMIDEIRSEICEGYTDLLMRAPPSVMDWMKNDANLSC